MMKHRVTKAAAVLAVIITVTAAVNADSISRYIRMSRM
jgi:hypothetical protein